MLLKHYHRLPLDPCRPHLVHSTPNQYCESIQTSLTQDSLQSSAVQPEVVQLQVRANNQLQSGNQDGNLTLEL
jgi:hypothetical protein